jgi:hypothetical protein
MLMRVALVAALLLAAFPATAQRGPIIASLTASQSQALGDVVSRGEALYRYDQAAWHTTDALIAERLPQAVMARIIGWVVTPSDDGLKVTYYGRDGDRRFAVFSAIWTGGTRVRERQRSEGNAETLVGEAGRLVSMRERVDTSGLLLCAGRPFNTVILPSSVTGAADSVYFLSPWESAATIPAGGHHRVDFVDGQPQPVRSFSQGCLNLPAPPPNAFALGVNHVLDPVPTEAQVFLALTINRPVLVMTRDAAQQQTNWLITPQDGRARIGTISMSSR